MVALLGADLYRVKRVPGLSITVTENKGKGRVLKLERGNMLDVQHIDLADIVMLETDVPLESHAQVCSLLRNLKVGARILTYLDLRKIWPDEDFFFRQVSINRSVADRFPTSWSVQRGHHFYLWIMSSSNEIELDFDKVDSSHSDECSDNEGCYSLCKSRENHLESPVSRFNFSRIGIKSVDIRTPSSSETKPLFNFFRNLFTSKKTSHSSGSGGRYKSACFPMFLGGHSLGFRSVVESHRVRFSLSLLNYLYKQNFHS